MRQFLNEQIINYIFIRILMDGTDTLVAAAIQNFPSKLP